MIFEREGGYTPEHQGGVEEEVVVVHPKPEEEPSQAEVNAAAEQFLATELEKRKLPKAPSGEELMEKIKAAKVEHAKTAAPRTTRPRRTPPDNTQQRYA